MHKSTTSREFFEAMYRESDDPWSFAESPYERERYERTLAALGTRVFRRAFEPGCSIGLLTARLASRCLSVEAIDISEIAVTIAKRRCLHLRDVHIKQGSLPKNVPDGSFDLVLFSEIGYYFDRSELATLIGRLMDRLEQGGTFLAVHWLGESPDHVLSGDAVHEVIGKAFDAPAVFTDRYDSLAGTGPGFRLDSWVGR
jgi:SAM-dependent methyltransferase